MKELTVRLSEHEVMHLANIILDEAWVDEVSEHEYVCFTACHQIKDNCNIAGFDTTENDVQVHIDVTATYQADNYYVESCNILEFCAFNAEHGTCLHLDQESIYEVCKAVEGRKIDLVSPYIGEVEPF